MPSAFIHYSLFIVHYFTCLTIFAKTISLGEQNRNTATTSALDEDESGKWWELFPGEKPYVATKPAHHMHQR
jgi:hypothetical protein